jgi:hypothetical protein
MGLQRHLPSASQVTNVRDLILLCRDVATRQVEHFNRLIITDEISEVSDEPAADVPIAFVLRGARSLANASATPGDR